MDIAVGASRHDHYIAAFWSERTIRITYNMRSRTVIALLALSLCGPSALAVSYGGGATQSVDETQIVARREANLDHWDSETLAYYTEEYRGYDVAILFYAQWDRNSHALAPYWDQISRILMAGSSKSRLIMSLFDCEMNEAHGELCSKLNIEAYPTMMFVGSGPYHDTDPITKSVFGKRSAGIMGESPLINSVKFQGNWQYGDAILDWIRTMQALSNWHLWTTEGFGRRLRNFLLPHKIPNVPLPVGVPGVGAAAATAAFSNDAKKAKALEREVDLLTKMIVGGDRTIQNLLLPQSNQDMFALMNEENVWENVRTVGASEQQRILYSCLAQMALNYCQRVSSKVATELITQAEAGGVASLEEILGMPTLEQDILNLVQEQEPYCGLMDKCVVSGFSDKQCRPDSCPFQNDLACRHLALCLDPEVQKEYAAALSAEQATI